MVPTAKPDRRVRRTRGRLHTALIELILERGYDQITVQDILDRADVGRSTFYHHYQGKDQLLLSGMDELETALTTRPAGTPVSSSTSLMAPLWPLFEHAATNHRLYRSLLGSRATTLALRAGRKLVTEVLTRHLRAELAIEDGDQIDMAVAFLINGLLGLITWWLDTQPRLTAEQVFAQFDGLATEGLRNLTG
jgi:AcrR family transcriptional regulator